MDFQHRTLSDIHTTRAVGQQQMSATPHHPDRPHTAHPNLRSTPFAFIAEEDEHSDGEMTPRASAAGLAAHESASATRRLSRDDTANDMHMLDVHDAAATNVAVWEQPEPFPPAAASDQMHQEYFRSHRTLRPRQSVSRLPSNASTGMSESSGSATAESKSQSLGRRFSRHKDKLRDGFQRYTGQGTTQGKTRRTSTAFLNTPYVPGEDGIDPALRSFPPQPTSPSKRAFRQVDDRPRKHRPTWLALADRKDTPAPPPAGMPMRPANSRHVPAVISAPGGDGARKAAALHNNFVCPVQFNQLNWALPDDQYPDIHTRRQRLGSLSSAADSGADLSTYSGSDLDSRDLDGDVNMAFAAPQPSFDITDRLPEELALTIFELLDARDICRAERVNKAWYALAQTNSVWQNAFKRKYDRRIVPDPASLPVGGAGIGLPNKPDQEWRLMHKARIELEANWRAGASDAGKAIYLSGHTDSVYCLQFDEEKIITGSRDRTIRVWDINTFQCLRVIGGPNVKPTLGPKVLRTVDYPSFHMATASVNGTPYGDGIYHTPDQWHDASILCLQYDNEILVTGSSDSHLIVWDVKTYEPIKRLTMHEGGVLDVALDSKHIVSCSKDSRIIVWDRETLEVKGKLQGHRCPVNAVQLRGKWLVSASGDGIARLWDIEEMKLLKEFSAKERGLAAVEFSEDMKYVLAGGNDNITYKFDRETGQEVMQFTGHSQLVRSLWLDSANDRVVSGSYDLDLRVYDFVSGQELWRGEEWTTSWMLAAKSDYRRIVATSQDGRILIVDFGIQKGIPTYASKDGMPVENIELLRGTPNTTAIQFRDPWAPSTVSRRGYH